jgi:hypothetical protein
LTKKKKSVYLRENSYLEDYYKLVLENSQDSAYLYHSDVFFVRAALAEKLGYVPSLREVEAAMKDAGWNENRVCIAMSKESSKPYRKGGSVPPGNTNV